MCIRDRKDAADIYYASLSYYPYQMYINWVTMDEGNVLYNDKKFATLLYQWHCDAFTEYSKVSDAGAFVKNNIYDFVDDSEKTVLVVDCENSDPYKLCATLKNLDYEVMQKITAIILFDDVHNTPTRISRSRAAPTTPTTPPPAPSGASASPRPASAPRRC